jgi:tRNA uridine 5-carboxymethylaminomethyl modification enzyme
MDSTLLKYSHIDEAMKFIENHPDSERPADFTEAEWTVAQEDFKYKYYIQKQDARVAKLHRMENARIPQNFDYGKIVALSSESRAKLEKVRPTTLGQASRISGIRNSDIMLLMVYLH